MRLDDSKEECLSELSLVDRAELFATWAHSGQTRANKITPYIEHPRAVVDILKYHGFTDNNILAAAWLHDTIEDCDVTSEEIAKYFGEEVCKLVEQLTCLEENDGSFSYERKTEILCSMVREMSDESKCIKMADRLHNLLSCSDCWNSSRIVRYARQGLNICDSMVPIPEEYNILFDKLRRCAKELIEEEESKYA